MPPLHPARAPPPSAVWLAARGGQACVHLSSWLMISGLVGEYKTIVALMIDWPVRVRSQGRYISLHWIPFANGPPEPMIWRVPRNRTTAPQLRSLSIDHRWLA